MDIEQQRVKEILKKLGRKDITIKILPQKKKIRVISLSILNYHEIKFKGQINLDDNELVGIIAHELIHITEKHLSKLFFILMTLIISFAAIDIYLLFRSGLNINIYCVNAIMVTIFISAYFILGRYMESRADVGAAKMVGKKPVIDGLRKVSTLNKKYADIIHGNVNKRIKRLENLKLPNFIR